MAESDPSQSTRLGKIFKKGARLAITGLSVFILSANLLAASLPVSAQVPTPAGNGYRSDGGRSDTTGLVPATGKATAGPDSPNQINVNAGATTTLISLNSAGTETGDKNSYDKAITEDGQTVIFDSYASNLVAGFDPANFSQIYLHTNNPNQTTQISITVGDASEGGNHDSGFPTISRDGKYAAWVSYASDLVSGVSLTNNSQVYLSNLTTHTTTLVSKNSLGQPGDNTDTSFDYYFPPKDIILNYPGYVYTPLSLSTDGTVLVYQTTAKNLTSDTWTGTISQVFAYNTQTGTNRLVSKSKANFPADCAAEYPRISGDGRYVVFDSCATNLVTNNPPGIFQVYMVELSTGVVTAISRTPTGSGFANGLSLYPEISKDGTTIAYRSAATNLDPADQDLNNGPNIYMAKFNTGTNSWKSTMISHNGRVGSIGESKFSAISSLGDFIAFSSNAKNLIPNDTNENCTQDNLPAYCPDVYLYDVLNMTVEMVSLPADTSGNQQSNKSSFYPAISGDGQYVAFDSTATNLLNNSPTAVVGGWDNIYVRDRGITPKTAKKMKLEPAAINFGNIGLNKTQQLSVTITSAGTGDLVAYADTWVSNSQSAFTIITTPQDCNGLPMPPGTSCTITVSFHQTLTRGAWTGLLHIVTTDPAYYPDGFDLPIAGGESGTVLNYAPDPIVFGNIGMGKSKSIDLTITSTGKPDLLISKVAAGPGAGAFTVKTVNCINVTIYTGNAGSNCTITATFNQRYAFGTWAGSVRVTSNDTENPVLDIPMVGGTGTLVNMPTLFKK